MSCAICPYFGTTLTRRFLTSRTRWGNPDAAERLIDQLEGKILEYRENPTVATKYRSSKLRKQQYYWFAVGNYMAFYVVEDDAMEMRRLLFGSRDLNKMPL